MEIVICTDTNYIMPCGVMFYSLCENNKASQIVFHAIIGEAYDEFTVKDVITNICRKMISRHPHVFGTDKEKSSLPDSSGWEKMKRQETGRRTVGDSLDDISSALPASPRWTGTRCTSLRTSTRRS